MLEATIVLTVALGKDVEALIITVLLVLNSVISFFQQARADDALALLRRRLAVHARVRRDGQWRTMAARDLVPGDVVRVRVGDIVPADVDLLDGHLSLDQSSLTGESVPVDVTAGDHAFGASVITRGEATAAVRRDRGIELLRTHPARSSEPPSRSRTSRRSSSRSSATSS